jgi:hypothetical protein
MPGKTNSPANPESITDFQDCEKRREVAGPVPLVPQTRATFGRASAQSSPTAFPDNSVAPRQALATLPSVRLDVRCLAVKAYPDYPSASHGNATSGASCRPPWVPQAPGNTQVTAAGTSGGRPSGARYRAPLRSPSSSSFGGCRGQRWGLAGRCRRRASGDGVG